MGRINRIVISVEPYLYPMNDREAELRLKAVVDGKEWTVVEILPNDHLVSHYDRIAQCLCDRLKQMILKEVV